MRCPRAPRSREFSVTGIRVEGLQRISEGTVYNTLPVNIGDRIDAKRIREALRALNATGFFRDVELRREDPGVLVVVVQERPSIRTFEVTGNKEIKSEDLLKSLRTVGLASGKILNRSTLEDTRQYLIEQYFARGRYDVRVDATVEEQPGNLVDVHVNIAEGKRVRIRAINVVGNERFSDKELLAGMELKASNFLSFYRGDDRYSRPALEGDLEKLRSYYMDRGYADFEITSTQVALAPEKDDLFITVNVFEGTTWKLGAIKLAGRFTVPEEVLRQYLIVRPGDQYSQRLIAATEEALRNRLNEAGFGYRGSGCRAGRECRRPVKSRSRSRSSRMRAPMSGASTSRACEGLAMRCCAGRCASSRARVLSNVALARSEERLQRLPYIEKVETETRRVDGTPDLVDIDVTVEEGPSSTARRRHRLLGTPVVHAQRQFRRQQPVRLGRPPRLEFNGGKYGQVYSVAHTDPYFTVDGISRSFSASYVERERLTSSFSQFTTQTYNAGASLGYPISEEQYLNLGLQYSHENLATDPVVRRSCATGCATTATTISAAWARTACSARYSTRWRSPADGCTTAATARCFRRVAAHTA